MESRSVLYQITHITRYSYPQSVSVCHNVACLTPRTSAVQTCETSRLRVYPPPATMSERTDFFGNQIHHFSFHEGFQELTVRAQSRVRVMRPDLNAVSSSPAWEDIVRAATSAVSPEALNAYQFAFDSPRVMTANTYREYGVKTFTPNLPIHEAVRELTRRVHEEFTFDTEATHVSTTVEEVFENRRGVCQDFAHLTIAILRSLGLPARYVSGYLRTSPPPGEQRLVGADVSHAWVSVWCGPELGWIDADPTNDVLVGNDHVTIAYGRDYSDITPVKGVYIGGGPHSLKVSVDVEPLTDPVSQ